LWLRMMYSTARCCTSASMKLSHLLANKEANQKKAWEKGREYYFGESQNENKKQIPYKLLREHYLLNTSSTCACNSWSGGWECISIFTYADNNSAFVGVLQNITKPNKTDATFRKTCKITPLQGIDTLMSECKVADHHASNTYTSSNSLSLFDLRGPRLLTARNLTGKICSCDSRQQDSTIPLLFRVSNKDFCRTVQQKGDNIGRGCTWQLEICHEWCGTPPWDCNLVAWPVDGYILRASILPPAPISNLDLWAKVNNPWA
jgi:hypothetical protein